MRRDLRLQQMQSRVERLPLELTALERERQLLFASKRFLLPDDRGERRPRREEEADERQMGPPVHPVGHLPERRRTLGGGQHVDQQRRHRHEHADRHDLKDPSLQPLRQAPWPHLEEHEGRRRRQAEDDGAEEQRGRRTFPSGHHQEADADRHRQRDGDAPRRLRDHAGRSRGHDVEHTWMGVPATGSGTAWCTVRVTAHGRYTDLARGAHPVRGKGRAHPLLVVDQRTSFCLTSADSRQGKRFRMPARELPSRPNLDQVQKASQGSRSRVRGAHA